MLYDWPKGATAAEALDDLVADREGKSLEIQVNGVHGGHLMGKHYPGVRVVIARPGKQPPPRHFLVREV